MIDRPENCWLWMMNFGANCPGHAAHQMWIEYTAEFGSPLAKRSVPGGPLKYRGRLLIDCHSIIGL